MSASACALGDLPVMAASAGLHVFGLKRPLPAAFIFAADFFPAAFMALPGRQESRLGECKALSFVLRS